MARRAIEFVQGGYYHIYNRGAHRASIFRDEADYTYVLRAMKEYSQKFNIAVIAYCLMPNHFHWLVRQDDVVPAGLLSQRVFNGYSKAFNTRYAHTGTIFQSRFRAKLVDNDAYLRHLCCYIHANPVKDGFATMPELWPYSNYPEWLGLRKGTLVDHDFVADHFPAIERYRSAVLDYLTACSVLPEELKRYLESL